MDILGGLRRVKASMLHGAGHALRFKGDAFHSIANSVDMVADGVDPRSRPRPTPRVILYLIHPPLKTEHLR